MEKYMQEGNKRPRKIRTWTYYFAVIWLVLVGFLVGVFLVKMFIDVPSIGIAFVLLVGTALAFAKIVKG
jgi:F0F1-type ATP synthase assembly protein I